MPGPSNRFNDGSYNSGIGTSNTSNFHNGSSNPSSSGSSGIGLQFSNPENIGPLRLRGILR